jgi:hypothetical protein
MADYYPLLSRAIAGLENNTSEQRRAVYDRARAALVRQLRGTEPPLTEPEITRERLGLEDAVRRIEGEARSNAPPAVASPRPAPGTPYPRPQPEAAVFPGSYPVQAPQPNGQDDGRSSYYEQDRYVPPQAGAGQMPMPPQQPGQHSAGIRAPARVRFASALAIAAVAVIFAGGVGLYVIRESISSLFSSGTSVGTHTEQVPVVKNEGRVGTDGADSGSVAQPPNQPAAQSVPLSPSSPIVEPAPFGQAPAVTQRAVLYEETPNNQSGAAFAANAVWRVDTVPASQSGQPPEIQLRADISIPDRKMQVIMIIKRNTDSTLPASHTLEIQFVLPPHFDNGGVSNVPGLLFKETEDGRGTALEGLSVRVTNDFFLIGLANASGKKEQNMKLLAERDWMDLPVLYENGRRAVLTIEKGVPGAAAFKEAMAAWDAAGARTP